MFEFPLQKTTSGSKPTSRTTTIHRLVPGVTDPRAKCFVAFRLRLHGEMVNMKVYKVRTVEHKEECYQCAVVLRSSPALFKFEKYRVLANDLQARHEEHEEENSHIWEMCVEVLGVEYFDG